MKYEVRVKLGAIFGGSERSVHVDAENEAIAITAAVMILDREGIDTVSILKVNKETS